VSRAASWQRRRRFSSAATSLLLALLNVVVSVARSSNDRSALRDTSCVPHEILGAPDFPESFGAPAGHVSAGAVGLIAAQSGVAREGTGASTSFSSCNDAASFQGVSVPALVRNSTSKSSSLVHPPPSDDQRVTYRQLWDRYGCDSDATYLGDYYGTRNNRTDSKQQHQRPIPTASTWLYLRKVYNRVVQQHLCRNDDDNVKSDYMFDSSERLCFVEDVDVNTVDDGGDDRAPTTTTSMNGSVTERAGYAPAGYSPSYASGFQVPVEIRYSPGKGRGLFALEDVPKDTLVWVSQYEGWMRSGRLYRLLLEALPTDAWRCDVMTFSYYSVSDEDEDPNESDESENWEDQGWEEEGWEEEGWEEEDGDELRGQDGSGKAHDRQMIARELENLIAKGNSIGELERSTERQTAHSSVAGRDETSDASAAEEGSVDEGADEEWDEWDDDDEYYEYDKDDYDYQDPSDRPRPHILVDLDEAALMNADWESPDGRQNVNVGLHAEEEDDDGSDDAAARDAELEDNADGWSKYVALRDIRAGEEILCAYSDFVRDDKGWAKVGL
jgi:SET domain